MAQHQAEIATHCGWFPCGKVLTFSSASLLTLSCHCVQAMNSGTKLHRSGFYTKMFYCTRLKVCIKKKKKKEKSLSGTHMGNQHRLSVLQDGQNESHLLIKAIPFPLDNKTCTEATFPWFRARNLLFVSTGTVKSDNTSAPAVKSVPVISVLICKDLDAFSRSSDLSNKNIQAHIIWSNPLKPC